MENQVKFENYAIFATGGKQYQAIPGKTIAVELLEGEVGATLDFNEVFFRKQGADKIEIGQPLVAGATVKASIIKHSKGPKLIVFKFKRRQKVRTKKGHRQQMTVLRIESI